MIHRASRHLRGTLKAAFALATLLGLGTTTSDASACGGLFCSNANPVNQAAERIIFAQNDDGTVSAAIEIQYQGPAHEFAWVLPVPAGAVEVGVASKVSFDRLQAQSNPLYNLQVSFEPCPQDDAMATGVGGAAATGATAAGGAGGAGNFNDSEEPPVTVVNQGRAGPYDFVQIEVNDELEDPADEAVQWLEGEGFDVTDIGPDVLRPYLADGLNLLAFRLAKDSDSGSIRPLLINYESDNPMIPIIPTAVAANPDMGVMVWVLGNGRAIPDNFYHLELNEAVINWFNPNSTYNDVIIAAADEAGGQGFVTEQAGPAGQFSEAIYSGFEQDRWAYLRTGTFGSILEFLQYAAQTFGSYDGFADLIADPEALPLREGATPEQFRACMECYFETDVAVRNEAYPSTDYDPETDPVNNMDVVTFLDKMDYYVITPLSAVRDLFDDNQRVTRLYTTLSPEEMTVDPVFDFNPELPDFDNTHTAAQIMQCRGDTEWRIELPQGMTITGNGRTWPITLEDDFPVNFKVVQLSTEGEGEEVVNNTAEIGGLLSSLGVGIPGEEMMEEMEDDMSTDDTDDVDMTLDLDDPAVDDDADTDDGTTTTDDDTDTTDDDTNASSDDNATDDGGDTTSDTSDDTADGTTDDGVESTDDEMSTSSGGGGCSVGSGRTGSGDLGWLALLGLPLVLRRRRR